MANRILSVQKAKRCLAAAWPCYQGIFEALHNDKAMLFRRLICDMMFASFIQCEQQCGKLRKTVALSVSRWKKGVIYPWADWVCRDNEDHSFEWHLHRNRNLDITKYVRIKSPYIENPCIWRASQATENNTALFTYALYRQLTPTYECSSQFYSTRILFQRCRQTTFFRLL